MTEQTLYTLTPDMRRTLREMMDGTFRLRRQIDGVRGAGVASQQRMLGKLEGAGLVRQYLGNWVLSEVGSKLVQSGGAAMR